MRAPSLCRAPLLLACCFMAALRAETDAPIQDSIAAQWEPQQVEVTFSTFTSVYTCSGIRSQLKKMIVAMGGRPDVVLGGTCTARPYETAPVHRIRIAFAVPVAAPEGAPPGETFRAQWKEVTIEPRRPRSIESGDCELVKEFAEKVLPLFNPREISRMPRCTGLGNQFLGEPVLKATVLVPLPPAGDGEAGKP